eukprot:362822-Chlamydomonas_euryale.AAC.40
MFGLMHAGKASIEQHMLDVRGATFACGHLSLLIVAPALWRRPARHPAFQVLASLHTESELQGAAPQRVCSYRMLQDSRDQQRSGRHATRTHQLPDRPSRAEGRQGL